MVRKQRVETYLSPSMVEAIEETDKSFSAFLREAARRELQKYEQEGYGDE